MNRSAVTILSSQRGMAMLTVMLLLITLTVLGLTAITVTGLENRMAGNVLRQETATVAAESCVGTAVNIIQQTINQGVLPATYSPSPVPSSNSTTLNQEILGQSDNNLDVPTGTGAAPNLVQTVGAYTVSGDIDRLYAKGKAGSGQQMFAGYEGVGTSAAAGGVEILYNINCIATNAATGTTNRIVAVYSCLVTGESCQKKL